MSLRVFHILFVTLSILLAIGFGTWSGREASVSEGAVYSIMAVAAFAVGLALIVYLAWFVRKVRTPEEERRRRIARLRQIKTLAVLMILGIAGARPLLACEVCYGDAEGPLIDAARGGIWLLFGLTAAMQIAFAAFFIHLWRSAARHRHRTQGGRLTRQSEGAS